MSREGYDDAKLELERAQKSVAQFERTIIEVDASDWIEEMKRIHLADARRGLAESQARLTAAQEAFKPFERPIKEAREHFGARLQVLVSLSPRLLVRFEERKLKDGVSGSKLIRQCIEAYLGPDAL